MAISRETFVELGSRNLERFLPNTDRFLPNFALHPGCAVYPDGYPVHGERRIIDLSNA